YLNNERRSTLSKVEELNIAKIHAELEALKNQTDPHFIFNSLNTLSFLISTDTASAKHFTNTLAGVYRYILLNKEKDFVLLKEEIEFISNYFYLLKIRFGNAINMVVEINDVSAEDFLIPPISLQILVENAVKHNEFSEKFPMEINVSIMQNYVLIKNAVRKKQILPNSTNMGLKNLNNRYQYLTKRNIIIQTVNNSFIAKLPILKF
ncbi:MAG TPA: histidine kinase, partial [Panacibacter sp.]|nr:histidine kinase [Panacibacter sp.]